ncbi:hypothetical protein [Anaeromicropila populeti]|uniref:Uncharacterized protein n=1 Tax=Anaeromicropila populeti TaxID=37658 RepID=A0A1I6IMA0_9FIRM|nr:hypothetical protein [Anaeromicropila populeti]SFR67875.1 hypothetical protein SAMN05661086_00900 [Anaeromicropila populeti]
MIGRIIRVLLLLYIWFTDLSGIREGFLVITKREEALAELRGKFRESRVLEGLKTICYILIVMFYEFGYRYSWIVVLMGVIPLIAFLYSLLIGTKAHVFMMTKEDRLPAMIRMFFFVGMGIFFYKDIPYYNGKFALYFFTTSIIVSAIILLRWWKEILELKEEAGLLVMILGSITIAIVFFYCMNTLIGVNQSFNQTIVRIQKTEVIETELSGINGRNFRIPEEDSVKGYEWFRNFYGLDVKVGDTVYIVVRKGGLGFEWREIYNEQTFPYEEELQNNGWTSLQ